MSRPGDDGPWPGWPPPAPAPNPDGRLRPLPVAGLFEVSGRILRRHAALLLGIALTIQLAGTILDSVAGLRLGDAIAPLIVGIDTDTPRIVAPTDAQARVILGALGLVLVAMLVSTILGAVATVGYATTVADDYEGRGTSLGGALRLALRRGIAAAGAAIVALGIPLGVALATAILAWVCISAVPGWTATGGPGAFLALVVGVAGVVATLALLVRFALAVIAVGVEGSGPLAGIRRSWRLTGGHAWRTFWVLAIVAFVVGVLGSLLAQLLGALVTDTIGEQLGMTDAFDLVVSVVISVVFLPVPVVVQTVLYFDLRVRDEGWQPASTADPASR